jgi:chromosome segregation ATPase
MIRRLQLQIDEQAPRVAQFDRERRELQSRIEDLQRHLDERTSYAQMALEEAETIRVRATELQQHSDQQTVLARNMFRENEGLKARLAEFENGADAGSEVVAELTGERTALIEQVRRLQQEKEQHAEQLRLQGESFKKRLVHAEEVMRLNEEQKINMREMKIDMEKQVAAFDSFQKSQGDLQLRYNRSQIRVQELQSQIGMLEQKFAKISHNPAYKIFSTVGLFPKKDG